MGHSEGLFQDVDIADVVGQGENQSRIEGLALLGAEALMGVEQGLVKIVACV